MRTEWRGTDFTDAFRLMGIYSIEVMMEQMSKAGNAVKESMRAALKSTSIRTMTFHGRLISAPSPRQFGARESMKTGEDSNPENMARFINSFPAEVSNKVIVAGSHPSFSPVLRTDGKRVGMGKRVKGVGSRTMAILQRMDSGVISTDYPKRTQLSKKHIATHWAMQGRGAAQGRVNSYLGKGYQMVFGRAMNRVKPRDMRIAI